ncbi:MAG TPA: arsenate reductase (azurin) small subunit, partial [Chloroflexota bacterium]|nr:arsenate reductase (azurin) small subunit [Chloroflexota bacterium]
MSLTRKEFVKASAAVALVAPLKPSLYLVSNLPFRAVKIANLRDLKVGQPITFQYPDQQSPANLVKLGRPAIGGVGAGQDVVAFSGICTHMGCPVAFKG